MKNKVRVLSLIMTLAIVLSSLVIVVPVSAEDPIPLKELNTETDGKPWTDFTSETGFDGGKGTKDDPYQIARADQLALLAYYLTDPDDYSRFSSKYYVLTADIDLAGHEWISISQRSGTTPDMRFKGFFNGQGHTIKNLTVTPATEITTQHQQVGLFGYIGGNAIIENFTLTGSIDIDNHNHASSNVGMVVAEVSGASTIRNVDVYGIIDVISFKAETPVAGIVGKSNNTIIENCTMNGSVTVYGGTASAGVIPCAGGITAWASGGLKITNTVNNADVAIYANGTTNSVAGGMVGKCGRISGNTDPVVYGTYLTNCINNGSITVNVIEGGKTPNNQRLGGIIGNLGRGGGNYMVNVEVVGCVNTGVIGIGKGVTRGGTSSGIYPIVGFMEGATVTLNGESVFKYCQTVISECYAYTPSTSLVQPHYYGSTNLNGVEKFSGVGISEDSDVNFAADVTVNGKTAAIRVSKVTVDNFLAAGYALDITYGTYKLNVANAEALAAAATEEGRAYVFTTNAQAGADVEASVSRTVFAGTDLESTYTLTAKDATWSDFYTEEFFAQSLDETEYSAGSKENPYIIYTAGQLATVSDQIARFQKHSGIYYVLAKDIDLSAHEWQPIGLTQPANSGMNYNGNYSANGTILGYDHTIKGLRLTQDTYNYSQSFIGYSSAWKLQDIVFDGVEIKTPETYLTAGTIKGVCGLIGAMYGGSLDNIHIENFDMDYVVDDSAATDLYFAGMVGYLNGGTITDCSISGSMNIVASGMAVKAGGIASRAKIGTITNTITDVDVTVTVDNENKNNSVGAGGFFGFFQADESGNTIRVEGCFNTGDITVNYSNKGANVGAAGFVGTNLGSNGTLEIKNCTNFGKITLNHLGGEAATNAYKAAIISYFNATSLTVRYCVSTTEETFVGKAKSMSGVRNNLYSDLGVVVDEGAGLLLEVNDVNETGMMFTASFDQSAYEDLIDEGYEVSFGMVIASTADFQAALGDVKKLKGAVVKIDYDNELTDNAFAGAVVNMNTDYLTTKLSAVASVTVSKGDLSHTYYSEFVDDAAHSRSAMEIVNAILGDRKEWKAEDEEIYVNLTNEGDFSPYTQVQLNTLKEVYADYLALMAIEQ